MMMQRQTPEDQQPRCRTARMSSVMKMQLQAQRANQVAISAKYSFEMTRCRIYGLDPIQFVAIDTTHLEWADFFMLRLHDFSFRVSNIIAQRFGSCLNNKAHHWVRFKALV